MQWSKLKSRMAAFVIPELRDRVDFHVTSYREGPDDAEKAWVVVDGKTVFKASYYRNLWQGNPDSPQKFGTALREYLDLPISAAITSSDPIIRAFAMLDKRLGARRFETIEIPRSEHRLVKRFYELRRSVIE